jgi:DNA-binding GntR family transcriptional regulator
MHSHREVRRAILDGRLRPGQEISQLQLAERLGVSRTPLREALRILQNEGLVLAETWRRVRVAPVSADDVVQLYAMRIALESLAVRVSVPQLSASDLDGLAAALDELDRALERECRTRSRPRTGASTSGSAPAPAHC